MSHPIIFLIKPAMQKAGLIKFSLERLDFIFDIVGQKTFQEIVRFEPTKSFQENRDNIMDCLKQLHKNNMLHKDFAETDITDLNIEITLAFAENSDTLTQIMKDNPFESEEDKPKEIYTYKNGNSGVLYETIILEGKSVFVYYDSNAQKLEEQLKFVEQIIEDNRIIKPTPRDLHVCKPYTFASAQMLLEYFQKAKNQDLDTLLVKAIKIAKRYVIQPKEVQKLLAIDTIWSYFQDIFSTTHYINATGDNNSGKTVSGNFIKSTAYRVVKLSDPSATHIFRTLGSFEAGQVVIVLDEAEKINDFPDMLTTLKAGYENGDLIPRSNTAGNYEVEFFYPYDLKFIISEKGLDEYKAKGVIDRTFSFNCIPGDPQDDIDITEVLETRVQMMPFEIQERLQELLDFRNTMLMFRLLHYNDKLIDIDVGVRRRNRQLVKPTLQLFYGTKSQQEVEETLEYFLRAKSKRKLNTLEATLVSMVLDWFSKTEPKQQQITKSFKTVWSECLKALGANIAGEDMTPDEYNSELGTIYKKTIAVILKDRLGAENTRSSTQRSLIFDYNTVKAVADNYGVIINVKSNRKIYSRKEDIRD
jgi:hypothetical protein